jgi:hypothetical protein
VNTVLINTDQLLSARTERLGRLDQEVQQRRVPHQAVHLIHRDDARLLVDQAVAADCREHLCIGQRLQDWIALQLVEAEYTRGDPVAATARQVDVGGPVEERRPRAGARTQAGNLVCQVLGDGLRRRLVAQSRKHVADDIAGGGDFWRHVMRIGETAIQHLQRFPQQATLEVFALTARQGTPQHRFVDTRGVADLLNERRKHHILRVEAGGFGAHDVPGQAERFGDVAPMAHRLQQIKGDTVFGILTCQVAVVGECLAETGGPYPDFVGSAPVAPGVVKHGIGRAYRFAAQYPIRRRKLAVSQG